MTALGVLISVLLEQVIPVRTLQFVAAFLFTFIGIQGLRSAEEKEEYVYRRGRVFTSTLFLVAMAEVGDKSQIFVIGQALVHDPFAVLIGAITGMAIVLYLSAYTGSRFLAKLPANMLTGISAVVFIVIGIIILFQLLI